MEEIKYYVLEGTFAKHLPGEDKLKEAIDAHLKYLDHGFKDGFILVSGPKVGVGGGIILLKTNDVAKFCREDPLVIAGIQEYRITEFQFYNSQDALREWFGMAQGR